MWFDSGLTKLFITSTLLHLGEDINLLVVSTFYIAKSYSQNSCLYSPLLIAKTLWEDVSMDFVIGLLTSSRNKDSVIVIVVYFSKIMHFIPYSKTLDATTNTDLYLRRLLDFMIFQTQ